METLDQTRWCVPSNLIPVNSYLDVCAPRVDAERGKELGREICAVAIGRP